MHVIVRAAATAVAVGVAGFIAAYHLRTERCEPPRTAHQEEVMDAEKATFAAGCFWGIEETFRQVEGVTGTAVGYTGGHSDNPTYEGVCSGRTGHAEAVQVEFNPQKVSYEELLKVFWDCHDPTTPDRQGWDMGTQYRSAIFYHTPEQKEAAEESMRQLQESGEYDAPIVTQIVPAATFWRAEEYHQRYLQKRGAAGCRLEKRR